MEILLPSMPKVEIVGNVEVVRLTLMAIRVEQNKAMDEVEFKLASLFGMHGEEINE